MELTADLIKRRSGHFDLSLVTLLDVSRARIRRLAQLEPCANLLELNLAHNELRSLEGLPSLRSLRRLQLSNNQLTSIDSLPVLPALEELSLTSNQLESINFDQLAAKVPLLPGPCSLDHLPNLHSLDFHGNPVAGSASALASRAFPRLITLNGEALALSQLLHEIAVADLDKTSNVVQEPALGTPVERLDALSLPDVDNSIDLTHFIAESTRKLQDLLQQCKHTLEVAQPERVFPTSSS